MNRIANQAMIAITKAAADRAPLPLSPPKPNSTPMPPMIRMWGKPRINRKAVVSRFRSVS